jgi:octaprenyl-diphosphate synthase
VIDYASDEATMGKGVGDDFRDGKMTLPVILAYARGSDADRAFWRRDAAASGLRRRPRPRDRLIRRPARWPTRSSARASTAAARSTRWPCSPASKAKAALTEAVEFAVAVARPPPFGGAGGCRIHGNQVRRKARPDNWLRYAPR